jgi:hypothetical protein
LKILELACFSECLITDVVLYCLFFFFFFFFFLKHMNIVANAEGAFLTMKAEEQTELRIASDMIQKAIEKYEEVLSGTPNSKDALSNCAMASYEWLKCRARRVAAETSDDDSTAEDQLADHRQVCVVHVLLSCWVSGVFLSLSLLLLFSGSSSPPSFSYSVSFSFSLSLSLSSVELSLSLSALLNSLSR